MLSRQYVVGDVASEFSLGSGGVDMTPGPDPMRPASSTWGTLPNTSSCTAKHSLPFRAGGGPAILSGGQPLPRVRRPPPVSARECQFAVRAVGCIPGHHLWVEVLGHPGRPLALVLGVRPQAVDQAAGRGRAAGGIRWSSCNLSFLATPPIRASRRPFIEGTPAPPPEGWAPRRGRGAREPGRAS
jgi:hypothetical protein